MTPTTVTLEAIRTVVLDTLRRVLIARGTSVPASLGHATVLYGGEGAVLDSLGWVIFCASLDDAIAERFAPAETPGSLLDMDLGDSVLSAEQAAVHYTSALNGANA